MNQKKIKLTVKMGAVMVMCSAILDTVAIYTPEWHRPAEVATPSYVNDQGRTLYNIMTDFIELFKTVQGKELSKDQLNQSDLLQKEIEAKKYTSADLLRTVQSVRKRTSFVLTNDQRYCMHMCYPAIYPAFIDPFTGE